MVSRTILRTIVSGLAAIGVIRINKGEKLGTAKHQAHGQRKFSGAQQTSITSGWATQPKPIDTDIRESLRKLRARARHEAQNNDYVKRFISLVKINVIGSQGIVLRPRIQDPNGKPDKLASKAILDGWQEWGRKGSAEVTGRMSWRMVCRLYIETLARDGEVLIRKVRNYKGNKFRFSLQFLDTELLDVYHNVDLSNGNTVRMSVELNEWRKPVAYYLLTTKQTADDYSYQGRKYQRVDADEIIHEFLPEWVWQTRGIPWVATGLLRLNMLAGYEEAELVASRAGASKFAVYEKTDDEMPSSNPTKDLEKDADGKFVSDFESGTIEVNPDGYKLSLIDPQHPNSAYKDFVKACLRGISAGLGVSYNSLANDLENVNYNSLRKGALDDQDVWTSLQDWAIESFCDVVYRDWLHIALLTDELTVNGRPLKASSEKKYQRVGWQPRRWQSVDPLKTMAAHEKEFTHKVRSPQSVIRGMGEDPDQVLDEWQEWQDMLEAKGIKQETEKTTVSDQPGNTEDADEEDDDEKNQSKAAVSLSII